MRLAGVSLLLAAVLLVAVPGSTPSQTVSRPNIVVVMTDDQDLRSLSVMASVGRLIADRGTFFRKSFVTTPLCCPSRASFLTGRYAHNHRVLTNVSPDGGYSRFEDSQTLPVWLDRAGYRTGYVGKYLNGYRSSAVPPGWDDWHASLDPSTYQSYDYLLNENGTTVSYGSAPSDYKTDVYADKAVDFIAKSDEPFFLTVMPLAPHLDSTNGTNVQPAPRHQGTFSGTPLPEPPSFDEPNVADKPAAVRRLPRITASEHANLTRSHRARLESLLAVDDLVKRVVEALANIGELNNTVIFFTSDNGYLLGEHRIGNKKSWGYEESARVPLLVRGPGVPVGATSQELVTNVDLAPTILEAAGVRPRTVLDGDSLFAPEYGREVLIENFRDPAYTELRTNRFAFIRHASGETELYDLARDPYELRSRHADPDYRSTKRSLADRLQELSDCVGGACP